MRSERGQATVEWLGILLLVTLALAALARTAPRADGHALGNALASSITTHESQVAEIRSGKRHDSLPPASKAFLAPPLVPHLGRPGAPIRLPRTPALVREMRRGAGAAWRRAWYACLVYERFRWAFLHPESRFPGYTMPPSEVLRIMNDCVSPVDLIRDWPLLRGGAGAP
jgi:hypothetical protein